MEQNMKIKDLAIKLGHIMGITNLANAFASEIVVICSTIMAGLKAETLEDVKEKLAGIQPVIEEREQLKIEYVNFMAGLQNIGYIDFMERKFNEIIQSKCGAIIESLKSDISLFTTYRQNLITTLEMKSDESIEFISKDASLITSQLEVLDMLDSIIPVITEITGISSADLYANSVPSPVPSTTKQTRRRSTVRNRKEAPAVEEIESNGVQYPSEEVPDVPEDDFMNIPNP